MDSAEQAALGDHDGSQQTVAPPPNEAFFDAREINQYAPDGRLASGSKELLMRTLRRFDRMPVNLTYSTILRMANGDLNGNLLFFWGGEINSLTIFILLLLLLCRFKVHVRLDGTLGSPIREQHRTRPCAVLAILWLDNGTIATISGHFLATRGIQIESGAKRLPQRGLVHSGRVLPQGYRELKNGDRKSYCFY